MKSRQAYHLEWAPQGQWGRSKAAGNTNHVLIGFYKLAPHTVGGGEAWRRDRLCGDLAALGSRAPPMKVWVH